MPTSQYPGTMISIEINNRAGKFVLHHWSLDQPMLVLTQFVQASLAPMDHKVANSISTIGQLLCMLFKIKHSLILLLI
jgi:HD-like signal output (HDOD) protein